MACKKETKVKTNFTKITIGLASPEEILENSVHGEVLKPERPSTTVPTSPSATVLLRAHFRSHQGLRVPLREVQAHPL